MRGVVRGGQDRRFSPRTIPAVPRLPRLKCRQSPRFDAPPEWRYPPGVPRIFTYMKALICSVLFLIPFFSSAQVLIYKGSQSSRIIGEGKNRSVVASGYLLYDVAANRCIIVGAFTEARVKKYEVAELQNFTVATTTGAASRADARGVLSPMPRVAPTSLIAPIEPAHNQGSHQEVRPARSSTGREGCTRQD